MLEKTVCEECSSKECSCAGKRNPFFGKKHVCVSNPASKKQDDKHDEEYDDLVFQFPWLVFRLAMI